MVEMLPDLLITGFRVFKHLEIPKLGQVNLITGKNNSGKSCLLEALRLYASGGSPSVMSELLRSREEIMATSESLDESAVSNIFHGRMTLADAGQILMEIGPRSNDRITFVAGATDDGPRLDIRMTVQGRNHTASFTLDRPFSVSPYWPVIAHSIYMRPEGLSNSNIELMWDSLVLTDLEDIIIQCLRLIAPEVERASLIASAASERRVAFVRVRGAGKPLPLRSLGDGMNRLFGIALAMVNAQDGLLLVDEIENGVHYSVQPKLWNFMVQLATRLNVQVFATTHSWDCITAFQQAAREHDSDGMLIRLDWRNGSVRPTEFTEHDLAIATRESIEVR